MREKIEHRRQRIIPVDPDTLRSVEEYLHWRRKFSYRGPLVFPFTRQRGWQIVEKLGRRIGIKGLHPHSLRIGRRILIPRAALARLLEKTGVHKEPE